MHAFASDVHIDLAETRARGHAADLAHEAAVDGYDVVIALGGDGTVNEVVNGLLADGPSPDLPALAVVPGGSANVFARTLGLPNSPLDAAGLVLDALRTQRTRTVGLGQANQRYFTFCAGLGLDAEVVHLVEELRRSGMRARAGLYIRAAARQFFMLSDRRRPALTLERPDRPPLGGLFLGIVSNTAPWTYLGRRPIDINPYADIAGGLDLFAMRRLDTFSTVSVVAQLFRPSDPPHPPRGRHTVSAHDLTNFTLRSRRPIAFQLDGDYLGEREEVTFRSVPKAIRVVI